MTDLNRCVHCQAELTLTLPRDPWLLLTNGQGIHFRCIDHLTKWLVNYRNTHTQIFRRAA